MTPAAAEAYRFGPFELRLREYSLTRDGAAVRLSPKAFDALRLLVERHGHLVDKEALMASLWPNTVVEDANLSVQMAAIRRALSDVDSRYIETVPKRGYRFVASVDIIGTPCQESDRARTGPTPPALVVLPLKILRGHVESDFLAFSLPDAIAASLADRPNLIVRGPLAARRFGGADADLAALADGMRARFALTGTLTRVDDRIAVRLQLLEIPSGTLLFSESRSADVHELFALQDAVAAAVGRTLAERGIGAAARARDRDVPGHAGAYAAYLRANQLAYEVSHWAQARDLYRASVDLDPEYAPAWARLGRSERLIAKFSTSAQPAVAGFSRAEEAFRRALSLNPDLSLGHSLYAQLMIDTGRADQAMLALLTYAQRRPSDPELYAGLVHALRYCGLLDESVAAHHRARWLDPTVPTSIHHTWWMKGEYERALGETFGDIGYMQGLALASLRRDRDAVAALRWREQETTDTRIRPYLGSLRALLEGDRAGALEALEEAVTIPVDGEARYYMARTFARLDVPDRAAQEMGRVVDDGFWCDDTFSRDPWLDSIRGTKARVGPLERARAHAERAKALFVQSGGAELLGPTS